MGEKRSHSQLRQLALDYAEGRIARSRYVRARSRFLDALSSRPPPPPAEETTVPRPLPDEATIQIQAEFADTVAPPGTPSKGRASIKTPLIMAAAGGIVALVAVLLLLFLGNGERGPVAPRNEHREFTPRDEAEPAVAPAASPGPSYAPGAPGRPSDP